MDIPDLVQRALGGEEIQAGVSTGDEDVVCFTPTRALVYKGEGLISDEGVEEFPLDVDRLSVKRSRRKTKFTAQYIDGPRSFAVPSNRGEDVLEHLLEGIFRVEEVVDADESVVGVYLFSELTLVVTEKRVVKHIGEAVWDEDYETYDFADVTGLDFERTKVATSIVIGIDGHPQRIKVPNDNARIVQQRLQDALFEFHDVTSIDELNRLLGDDDEEPDDVEEFEDDLTFGSGIDPLVTDRDDDPARGVEDPFATGAGDDAAEGEATSQEPADDPLSTEGSPAPDSGDAADTADPAGAVTDAGGEATDAAGEATDGATASTGSDDGGPGTDAAESDDGPGYATGRGAGTTSETETTERRATSTGDDAAQSDGESAAESGESTGPDDVDAGTDSSTTADSAVAESTASASTGDATTGGASTGGASAAAATLDADVATREDVEAIADRLEELTDAVDRQNELLKRQHRAMKQLVERLDSE